MQLRRVDVNATSSAMLMTSHRRCFNVVLSLCIYWVDKLTLRVHFQVQLKRKKENEIYIFGFILFSILLLGLIMLGRRLSSITVTFLFLVNSPTFCLHSMLRLCSFFIRAYLSVISHGDRFNNL